MKHFPLILLTLWILAPNGYGREFYTELFSTQSPRRTNNLDFQTFTFTPDGSTNFYAVCREPATQFPTDPTGGNVLNLGDDTFATITLPGTNTVAVYGTRTNAVHVGSNGYITFHSGDTGFSETIFGHFLQPRVSALFDDLHPPAGSVTWKTISNRVAVTYLNVPERATTNRNSFQIELFFDGAIRLTYLRIDALDGLVGLSAGGGTPDGFTESDFNAFPSCALTRLALSISSSTVEGSGPLTGQITLPYSPNSPVSVNLKSSDPSEATVPSSVIVAAGSLSASFELTIIDDNELDGPQYVTLTASAPGFVSANSTILVADNETTVLQIIAPNTVTEGSGLIQGFVHFGAPASADTLVQLHSSDLTEIIVPSSVIMPAGQTSAPFELNIVDDLQIDGSQVVTITASVSDWLHGTIQIVVLDNETKNLTLTIPAQAKEGDSLLANSGRVQITGTWGSNLVVSLFSSDTSELIVPSSITIPAGATSTVFNITIVDDLELDGAQTVSVTCSAPGFVNGSAQITIYDNESPAVPTNPSPSHMATEVSAITSLAWFSGEAMPQTNTYDVYLGTSPTLTTAQLVGSTTNTNWSLPTLAPLTTYYWQIVSRREGQTASPVWQFTTRGVNHFEITVPDSPQQTGVPFEVTIAAKDELNRIVTNYHGAASLSAVLGSNETLKMLSFTGYADLTHEYPRTLGAIRDHFTNFLETSTTSTNAATLQSLLADKHLFLVVEQENATATILSNLATNWTTVLSNFAFQGGSVVVCSYQQSEHLLLANSGLLHLTKLGTVATTNLATTVHPLTAGVENQFQGHYISRYQASNGTSVILTVDSPVVITRNLGAGSVTLFGTDFYTNTPMDRVLANAVSRAYTNALPPVVMSPATTGTFSNGTWSGSVTIGAPGHNVTLRAKNGDATGKSSAFEVLPPALVTLQVRQVGGELRFEWPAPRDGAVIEFTESLVPPIVWQPATSTIPTEAGVAIPFDPENQARRFFRLVR